MSLVAIVVVVSGCDGSGGRSTASEAASPTSEPSEVAAVPSSDAPRESETPVLGTGPENELQADTRYAAPDWFVRPVSLHLPQPPSDEEGAGWYGGAFLDTALGVRVAKGPGPDNDLFQAFDLAFDEGDADAVVKLIRKKKGMRFGPVEPVTVDGNKGVAFEAQATRTDVVFEEPPSLEGANPLPEERLRMHVVQLGDGGLAVFTIRAVEDRFESFLPVGMEIVESLQFD